MSKRSFNRLTISPGLAGWDAAVDGNFANLENLIETYPWPIYEVTGALPAANVNDRALAFKKETSNQWTLYYSDGTSWHPVTFQPTIQAAAESADKIDFTFDMPNGGVRALIDVWVSTSQYGAPGGAQAVAVTGGTIIETVAANQHYRILTDGSGQIVVGVTIAGAATRWVHASVAGTARALQGTWV